MDLTDSEASDSNQMMSIGHAHPFEVTSCKNRDHR